MIYPYNTKSCSHCRIKNHHQWLQVDCQGACSVLSDSFILPDHRIHCFSNNYQKGVEDHLIENVPGILSNSSYECIYYDLLPYVNIGKKLKYKWVGSV